MFHAVACGPTFSDDIIRQAISYLVQVLCFTYREIQKYRSARTYVYLCIKEWRSTEACQARSRDRLTKHNNFWQHEDAKSDSATRNCNLARMDDLTCCPSDDQCKSACSVGQHHNRQPGTNRRSMSRATFYYKLSTYLLGTQYVHT
jgi:hypothetical protein